MHVVTMYHLQDLAQSSFACEEDESRDVDDCIGTLSRVLARYDSSLIHKSSMPAQAVRHVVSQHSTPAWVMGVEAIGTAANVYEEQDVIVML